STALTRVSAVTTTRHSSASPASKTRIVFAGMVTLADAVTGMLVAPCAAPAAPTVSVTGVGAVAFCPTGAGSETNRPVGLALTNVVSRGISCPPSSWDSDDSRLEDPEALVSGDAGHARVRVAAHDAPDGG